LCFEEDGLREAAAAFRASAWSWHARWYVVYLLAFWEHRGDSSVPSSSLSLVENELPISPFLGLLVFSLRSPVLGWFESRPSSDGGWRGYRSKKEADFKITSSSLVLDFGRSRLVLYFCYAPAKLKF
jgi:hypothetical protein